MKRQKKKSMYVVLVALVLMISIGYAALSANLRINGTSRINAFTWDVHFENAQATENSTVIPTVAPTAPAASKLQTVSYDVTFDTPGQVYEFTIDVVNGGSIDAMIDTFTSTIKIGDGEETAILADKSNLPSYLDYDVTYDDDTAIANNHLLAHNASETIKVKLTFKRNITTEQLAEAANKVINLNVGLNYKQADGTEVTIPRTTTNYVVNSNAMNIGQVIPNTITVRTGNDGPAAAMADWAGITGVANDTKPIFLRNKITSDNKIAESYIGFVVTDEMAAANSGMTAGTYYIRGGIDESALSAEERTVMLANAKVIYDAFGSICSSNPYETGLNRSSFSCDVTGLNVGVYSNGYIIATAEDNCSCAINSDSSLRCRQQS